MSAFGTDGLSFTSSNTPDQVKQKPSTPVNRNHTPATDKQWTGTSQPKRCGRVSKIIEICSLTLAMSSAAINSPGCNWKALTPLSIEQGYDLLTQDGRDRAEKVLRIEKPALTVGEWMCDPFSQVQNLNIGKG